MLALTRFTGRFPGRIKADVEDMEEADKDKKEADKKRCKDTANALAKLPAAMQQNLGLVVRLCAAIPPQTGPRALCRALCPCIGPQGRVRSPKLTRMPQMHPLPNNCNCRRRSWRTSTMVLALVGHYHGWRDSTALSACIMCSRCVF